MALVEEVETMMELPVLVVLVVEEHLELLLVLALQELMVVAPVVEAVVSIQLVVLVGMALLLFVIVQNKYK